MLHKLGILILVAFLCLSVIFQLSTVQAQDHRHLCYKIMSGHFDRIDFKSISYNTYRDMLVLFEGDRQYLVPDAKSLPANHSTLPIGAYMGLKDGEVGQAVETMQLTSPVKAVFFLELRKGIWATDVSLLLRRALNIVTEDAEYIGVYQWIRFWKLKEMWSEKKRVHPDYTLITESSRWGSLGWVIHKDIYDNQVPFIVYDLNKLSFNKMTLEAIQRFDADEATRTLAPFFYLEKSEFPNEVVLVHREHINVHRQEDVSTRRPQDRRIRSLFSVPPVGYRHKGYVYLMDVAIGCVYVINDFGYLNTYFAAKPSKDQYRHRRNIPYEQFFSCDPRLYPLAEDLISRHPPDRCQTVYRQFPIPVTLLVDRYSKPFSYAIVTAVVSLLLIGILIAFYCKFCTGPMSPDGEPKKDLEDGRVKAKACQKHKRKKTPKTSPFSDKDTLLAFRQPLPSLKKDYYKEQGADVDDQGTSSSSSSSPHDAFSEKKANITSSNKKKYSVPKRTMSLVL